jgi:hypothetical protein
VRGLGEALSNLALMADYQSLGICGKQLGTFLETYVGNYKRNMPDRFFYYDFPEKHRSPVWVENEACGAVDWTCNAFSLSSFAPPMVGFRCSRVISSCRRQVLSRSVSLIESSHLSR